MWFARLPIKRKLVMVMLLTSFCILGITGPTLLIFEFFSYKDLITRNMLTLADMIASNSGVALAFDDQTIAQEILNALRDEPEITAAVLYRDGEIYARYPMYRPSSEFPRYPGPDGIRELDGRLHYHRSVYHADKRAGTLYMEGDLRGMYRRLGVYAAVLGSVFAGSIIVAFIFANLVQKRISEPMLNLARTAKIVSARKDYSLRATKTSGDEVGDLVDAFNAMLDQIESNHSAIKESESRLSAALRAKDAFLATLSHELRTPLSPVLLLATEAAENPDLTPELRRIFDTIRQNIELEARLIDDLLDLTRIARGKLTLDLRQHDANAILRDTISMLRPELERAGISLVVDLAADQSTVVADDVRLQQVFWNVLKNAIKFTPDGGTIRVHTSRSPDRNWILHVVDTGIGMTREELDRAFDAFTQGEHAAGEGATRYGGVGLGLAISKTLVELQKGEISAASGGRGQGCTLRIQLPLVETLETAAAPEHSAPSPPTAPELPQTPALRRVLLVEDHEPTRTALAHLLRRRKFEVMTSGSVAEARRLAGQYSFDLLISDIGLPDGNGYDLMASLKEQAHLKAIALTGYGMEQDVLRSQAAGFSVHLTKPVRAQTLDRALASVISEPEIHKPA